MNRNRWMRGRITAPLQGGGRLIAGILVTLAALVACSPSPTIVDTRQRLAALPGERLIHAGRGSWFGGNYATGADGVGRCAFDECYVQFVEFAAPTGLEMELTSRRLEAIGASYDAETGYWDLAGAPLLVRNSQPDCPLPHPELPEGYAPVIVAYGDLANWGGCPKGPFN